jgi:hypothetical protein
MHKHSHVYGKGVYHGCTYAMETAGDLVALAAELTSGMEDCHDSFQSGNLRAFVNVYGDAAAIVYDAHAVVGEEGDLDVIGKATHSLVTGVVEDLGNEVVEAIGTSGTDVHAGTLPDRFQALEDGNR